MPRFVETDEGIVLNINSIEGIKRLAEGGTEIYTHHRKYRTDYPFDTIISILKEGEVVEGNQQGNEAVMNRLNAVLERAQHFAG